MTALVILCAALVDIAVGWPDALFRRIRHPVVWIGAVIDTCEGRLNTGRARRAKGVVCVLIVLTVSTLPALAAVAIVPGGWPGLVVLALLAWPFLALRSMHDHVVAVARPLMQGDTEGARAAVAMIVGRDPSQLDDAGIARAALESLAENTSDGIVAPVFWGVLLGLPGLVAYKAINTMDSMIGHRTPRYEAFGWAAARLDDLVNLLPARLTGVIFAFCRNGLINSLHVMRQDAPNHRSPNAGWPEAAMAAALGVRLSGPRVYADRVADEPWVNADAPDPQPGDVQAGLALYRRAMAALLICLAALAALSL